MTQINEKELKEYNYFEPTVEKDSDGNDAVKPFPNGTSYEIWISENCHNGCMRFKDEHLEMQSNHPDVCPIEGALCGGLCSGLVTVEIWKRMGNPWKTKGSCLEFADEKVIRQESIKEYAKHQNDVFDTDRR